MLRYHDRTTRWTALRCRLFGYTDYQRWIDAQAYDNWEDRTRLMAELISPGSSVIEFGAGKRLLERHLEQTCTYVASDLVDRGPGTIVLDLNERPLPGLDRKFDVAVLAGVLEYVQRLPSFLTWLSQQADSVLASYSCAKSRPGSLQRLRESYIRAGAGWVNSYSEKELLKLFNAAGMHLQNAVDWRTEDGDERIYHLQWVH